MPEPETARERQREVSGDGLELAVSRLRRGANRCRRQGDESDANRWLQHRHEKRQEQLQLDVLILEEGHALRQEAYQREREALQALAKEERECRHQPELAALEAQMQARSWRP